MLRPLSRAGSLSPGRNSIKSRLQVQKYNGVVDCAQKIYKHEGLGGFFRGALELPSLAVPVCIS